MTRARKIGAVDHRAAGYGTAAAWSRSVRGHNNNFYKPACVIKTARYTCSIRGRPLLTARTTPVVAVVGVAVARGRGGHSREGARRGETGKREGSNASGVFTGGERRRQTVEPRGSTFVVNAVRGWEKGVPIGLLRGGGREGGGVVFTRHGCWCYCCCCCCFC